MCFDDAATDGSAKLTLWHQHAASALDHHRNRCAFRLRRLKVTTIGLGLKPTLRRCAATRLLFSIWWNR